MPNPRRCARWVTLLVAASAGCAPTCSHQDSGSAPQPDAGSHEALVFGDANLEQRLQAALAAKGPDYRPRTKHLDAAGKPKYTNRLILETSPYLLQHAHNPVSWFPWGDEAFALAKQLGRPVFLSVGYSTCHWCHVMEEESFEDEAIAGYINDHYIPIKVDREERPDVDAIYMHSVQLLTGRGGWPMSVWLTHERKPFYGGTYFPARDGDRGMAKGFITLLKEQHQAFTKSPTGVADDAAALAKKIAEDMALAPSSGLPAADTVNKAIAIAAKRYDPEHGGPKGRPKFPSGFPVRLLLRHAARVADDDARRMALDTLTKMQAGGMYDHVGGGFHRYAVDERWLVPHFEKMLYDNALLALAYLEGFQLSGDANYRRVASEILDYVDREMTHPKGGYYSATDADSLGPKGERQEGYYFTWTPDELDSVLGAQRGAVIARYYAVTPAGNFEGRNILHTPESRAEVARASTLKPSELDAHIAAALPALRVARDKRPKPLLDDKIQASINGLMIGAMARGARVLGEPRYLASARRAAEFVLAQLLKNGRLRHSWAARRASTSAFAEDYAFVAAGLLDLFEADQDARYLRQAIVLMESLEQHHARPDGGYYRSSADGEKLLAREMETRDGAVPAAASVATMCQLRLHALTDNELWRSRAERTLKAFATRLEAQPWTLDDMMLAVDAHRAVAKEVALVIPADGDAAKRDGQLAKLRSELDKRLLPHHVLVVTSERVAPALTQLVPWVRDKPAKGGEVTAYLCERGACELPTSDPAVFAKQLAKTATGGR